MQKLGRLANLAEITAGHPTGEQQRNMNGLLETHDRDAFPPHQSDPPVQRSNGAWKLHVVCILLIAVVYSICSYHRAVDDSDDGLYIHVAQQMLQRADWVTPYADGVRFLDKPPLLYWSMAASFHLLGTTEFAARVPTLLAVLATAWLLMKIGSLAAPGPAGAFAGMIFAFSAGTFLFTREAMADGPLMCFVTLAMYAFLRWYLGEGNARSNSLLFYASMAAAVLSKSLIGVVFPLGAVLVFLLIRGELALLKRFSPIAGTALFIGIAAPWHLLAALRNPGFLTHYFLNEQIMRFFNKRTPVDYNSVPLATFWALFLLWILPWTAFLPAAARAWRRSFKSVRRSDVTMQLCVVWGGVILVFFSLSSRSYHYTLPALAPVAAALSVAIFAAKRKDEDVAEDRLVRMGFRALAVASALLLFVVTGGAIWLMRLGLPLHGPLRESRQIALSTAEFGIFQLPAGTLRSLAVPLIGVLTAFILLPPVAWLLMRRARLVFATSVLCVMMAVFCAMAQLAVIDCQPVISSRDFGLALAHIQQPGDRVVIVGDYEGANSIQFYTTESLDYTSGEAYVLEYGLGYPDAPRRRLGREEVASAWRGSQRMFALLPSNLESSIGLQTFYPVVESAGRILVCNRPITR